ncbi:hypothetical protein K493DRAFT_295616 [Basidiobolus meristosporus CBS 931.73]|uniref:FAR1 domain-containing protein n=1 Tax=Basidiobolus meristosporus CBS 931.73 TaxID=1314790 RepID=A0A1Y1ZAV0_9FUNG|nr:hypothetical protein K493DRAFT_295616 [Basidiobolus meristosporus CBS 931.73]|eukprot:ORY07224.1 hypothetical protein K493DRAFT_295616 [Basidiobolus meristosporus CBS 931.73]
MDFREIFAMQFSTAQEAFEWCQQLAKKCGFGVRRRTSKSSTIYIVCSREGRPESKKNTVRKRNRTSERCNCDWRVVLYLTDKKLWEFRAGKCMIHNHCLSYEMSMSPPPFGSQTPQLSPITKLSKPRLVPLTDLTQKYQVSSFQSFQHSSNSAHFDFTPPSGNLCTPTSTNNPSVTQKSRSFENLPTKLPPIATPPLEHANPGFESVDSDMSEEEPPSRAVVCPSASRSLALEFILNKQ